MIIRSSTLLSAASLLIALTVVPAEAQSPSGENPVLGTWKLKSFVREVIATGEKINQFGEHPTGYLSYSADGRMYAIATSDSRVKPRDANPADEERVKLHQTMFAYAGTYTLEGEKVIHHLDISWNEGSHPPGTDMVRFYKLDGNVLTITTAPNKSMVDGREGRGVLVWEKVKAPTAAKFATKEEATAMVKKAVALIKEQGPDKAYAEFSNKGNRFHDRDLYVTVLDLDGTLLAHGQRDDLIGKSLIELKDPDGKLFMKERVELARQQPSFWQNYKFMNPATKKVEPKEMYCERLNETAVCGGVYSF
jgi:cytochrome c